MKTPIKSGATRIGSNAYSTADGSGDRLSLGNEHKPVEKNLCAGSRYRRIYATVSRIPTGRVASYGQIAALTGGCTPRMVGYAMAALPYDSDVPWHRVVNRQGMISPRKNGDGALIQRALLENEGIAFDATGRVDLAVSRWAGPESKTIR